MNSFQRSLLILLFSLSFLSACGGTETGNPPVAPPSNPTGASSPAGSPASGNSPGQTESQNILSAVCGKLVSCFPSLTDYTCKNGVLAQTNLVAAFGLSSSFGSYQAIIDAQAQHTISANSTYAAQCVSDVANLVCGSPSVTSAYTPASPGNFSNVVNLIPTSGTSCRGVF